MEFYTQLYVGERVKNLRQIKSRLQKGRLCPGAHIIALAAGNDLLEIYDSKVFLQKYYRAFPRMIIGIARDYNEAVEMVTHIIEETLKNRGDCNVKAYLANITS